MKRLAARHLVELEGDDDVGAAEPARQALGLGVDRLDRHAAAGDLEPRRPVGPAGRVDEGDDLVAQVVGEAEVVVVGEGERGLERVAAGADHHGRPPPGAEPRRELLGGGPDQRHGGTDADPAGHHPDAGKIDLEQIEQGRVGDQRQQRHHDDVADLLPERPPAAVVAQILEGRDAGERERDEDAAPLEAPVLVGEVDEAAEPEGGGHGRDVDAGKKERAAKGSPRRQSQRARERLNRHGASRAVGRPAASALVSLDMRHPHAPGRRVVAPTPATVRTAANVAFFNRAFNMRAVSLSENKAFSRTHRDR